MVGVVRPLGHAWQGGRGRAVVPPPLYEPKGHAAQDAPTRPAPGVHTGVGAT